MNLAAISHYADQRNCFCLHGGLFRIRIQVAKGDMSEVILHYQDKYIPVDREDTREKVTMKKVSSDLYHDYYEADVTIDMLCLRYFFELNGQDEMRRYYGDYRFFEHAPDNVEAMFDMPQILREEECFNTPQWAVGKTVYQIFPTRFASSKPVDPAVWYKAPIGAFDDLGGDLKGITERLPYLKDLGVDILYLTPIFRSNSSHKYDIIDYYEIDPSLGTADDLHTLIDTAHEMGMYVMLDAVFNHTSPDFFAFRNIKQNGVHSPYINWYYMDEFPIFYGTREKKPNFKSFAYYGGMPKLNMANEKTADYFVQVALHYVREFHIDGWRLDVADEIGHAFWKKLRYCLKAENPNVFIVGENWHYAPDFLTGDEWDSLMNYPFYKALTGLICYNRLSAEGFLAELGFLKGQYQSQVLPLLWNMMDSHDVERFIHTAGHDKQKQKLAAAIMLLFPGIPMIYYGDEVGLEGAFDPDNRRGMLWSKQKADMDMHAWYKSLLALRKRYPALASGECAIAADDTTGLVTIQVDDTTLAVMNVTGEELLWSNLDETREFDKQLLSYRSSRDLLSGREFTGKLSGNEVVVLKHS
ncbi:Glycosidase [Lachnospiraceae bacterium C10]|nr:Glycosidase [Lachnospiraceae bacterium C10]